MGVTMNEESKKRFMAILMDITPFLARMKEAQEVIDEMIDRVLNKKELRELISLVSKTIEEYIREHENIDFLDYTTLIGTLFFHLLVLLGKDDPQKLRNMVPDMIILIQGYTQIMVDRYLDKLERTKTSGLGGYVQ